MTKRSHRLTFVRWIFNSGCSALPLQSHRIEYECSCACHSSTSFRQCISRSDTLKHMAFLATASWKRDKRFLLNKLLNNQHVTFTSNDPICGQSIRLALVAFPSSPQLITISVPLHHVTVFHVHHPHLGGVWQRRAQHAKRKDLLRRRHDDRL